MTQAVADDNNNLRAGNLRPAGGERNDATVQTPLWRRITAVFTLSSMVVLGGLILAVLITFALLMMLYVLEQAIA